MCVPWSPAVRNSKRLPHQNETPNSSPGSHLFRALFFVNRTVQVQPAPSLASASTVIVIFVIAVFTLHTASEIIRNKTKCACDKNLKRSIFYLYRAVKLLPAPQDDPFRRKFTRDDHSGRRPKIIDLTEAIYFTNNDENTTNRGMAHCAPHSRSFFISGSGIGPGRCYQGSFYTIGSSRDAS